MWHLCNLRYQLSSFTPGSKDIDEINSPPFLTLSFTRNYYLSGLDPFLYTILNALS